MPLSILSADGSLVNGHSPNIQKEECLKLLREFNTKRLKKGFNESCAVGFEAIIAGSQFILPEASILLSSDAVTAPFGDVVCYINESSQENKDFLPLASYAVNNGLPIIFVVINIFFAMNPYFKQLSKDNISYKAENLGITSLIADGKDLFAYTKVLQEAVDRIRKNEGPTLIEALMILEKKILSRV